MILSDLISDEEIDKKSIDPDKWCSCINDALTKERYLYSIRKVGFSNVEVLEEKLHIDGDNVEGRVSCIYLEF
jgi:arsenite methyltransferase